MGDAKRQIQCLLQKYSVTTAVVLFLKGEHFIPWDLVPLSILGAQLAILYRVGDGLRVVAEEEVPV